MLLNEHFAQVGAVALILKSLQLILVRPVYSMAMRVDEVISEVLALPHHEKVQVLDAILIDLNKDNCDTENAWAEEARRRWTMYKAGQLRTVSYDEVMQKYKHQSS